MKPSLNPQISILNLGSRLAFLLGIGCLLFSTIPTALANITVANIGDSLPGSLRQAIANAALTPAVPAQSHSQSSEPIPLSELGAKAGAQYQGDGLSVVPTPEGARLRCVFQKLEGQVTREGLWLVSTVEPQTG